MMAQRFLGSAVGLAMFLIVNATLSLACLALWRIARGGLARRSADTRAQIAFGCRVAPPIVAGLVCTSFFLPAWLAYEPVHTSERIGMRLAIISGLALLAFGAAIWRVGRLIADTQRLSRTWLRTARPFAIPGVAIRAFQMNHPFPVMAVVGVMRPRLFIADQVRSVLSDDELQAAAGHEIAHMTRADNFKRVLMLVCRSVVPLPGGHLLDEEWSLASEIAADEEAASRRPAAALDLADALLKIARLVRHSHHLPASAAAFITSAGIASVAERVRLLANRSDDSPSRTSSGSLVFALGAVAVIVTLATPGTWLRVHAFVEFILPILR